MLMIYTYHDSPGRTSSLSPDPCRGSWDSCAGTWYTCSRWRNDI